jgi:hypothetical protein
LDKNHQNNFIEQIDQDKICPSIHQDHITIDSSNQILPEEPLNQNTEHLTSIINDIQRTNQFQKLLREQESSKHSLSISKPSNNIPIRYQTQRIDKVSDLEIVKQGKGFKIGYIDRQGTDQRIILTKRIEGGADILERDPHIRLPYKGQRILNQIFSSVLYTNGYNSLQEDTKFQRITDDMEVPIIGTNPKHFDEVCLINSFEIFLFFCSFLVGYDFY